MLLYLLYPIVRLALWIFFRRLEVKGREQVPTDRPLVFVANHPNVMLDALLLGASIPGRPARFLGKSTLFANPLYAFFLRRLGVIPVAREQDPGARTGRNQDMLRAACQVLHQGRSLALFPEGLSHADPRVRRLKTGAARIALRVEEEAKGRAGVCIVPVGLTYSDPGLFRSEVYVHFGAPIATGPFLPAYRASRHTGAAELTEATYRALLPLTWNVENPDLETLIRDLGAVYTDCVVRHVPDSAGLGARLRAGQELIKAVGYYAHAEPELVRSFAARLRLHHRKLRRLRLEPYNFAPEAAPGPGRLVVALLLSPLALYGLANNALPYLVPRLFVRPYRHSPEMVGTVKLAVGAVAFPLYYLLRTVIAYALWGWHWALFYCGSLPLSGLLLLYYNERVLQRWPLWQDAVAPARRHRYLRRLSDERRLLLADLDAVKDRYLAHIAEGGT